MRTRLSLSGSLGRDGGGPRGGRGLARAVSFPLSGVFSGDFVLICARPFWAARVAPTLFRRHWGGAGGVWCGVAQFLAAQIDVTILLGTNGLLRRDFRCPPAKGSDVCVTASTRLFLLELFSSVFPSDLENFKGSLRSAVSVREGQGVVLLCGPPPHAGGKEPVPGGKGTCRGRPAGDEACWAGRAGLRARQWTPESPFSGSWVGGRCV